jgi:hypothetical protein
MASTITLNGQTVSPLLVLTYETTRNVPTVVHRIIGRGDPDVTLQPAGLRSGTLDFLCASYADADSVVVLLTTPGVLTLTDDDVPSAGMAFVVTGDLLAREDDQGTSRWIVSVPYAEVAP